MNFRHVLAAPSATFFLSLFLVSSTASAQTKPPEAPVKEVAVAASAFSLADPVPSWVEPVAMPEASVTDPFVIRLADTQFLVDATPVVYVHFALTINDAAALSSAGQLPIQFVPQYQKLRLHGVHILRGKERLDRTKSSTVRFLQRETGLEQGVYSDVVTASVLVNDLRVGDTLEYSYSRHGLNPVFGGKYVEDATWDQTSPMLLRRVVLNHPVNRKISWKVVGDSPSKPVVPKESTVGGLRKLVFEEQGMAEVATEQYTPADHVAYRWLHFSEFTGWEDVVTWAGGLFQPGDVADKSFREIVEKLRAMATDEERVVGALEFVQSEIRYFSVSLGESSHRPTQPGVVLERRYGDCKDKSLLLVTLLKELGIESKPVLLSVSRRKGLNQSLPSPEVFDHAIVQVMVGGKTYYLDPTRLGQHGRLDRMGQTHEGAEVLVVSPDTRGPVTVASANASDLARTDVVETVTITEFGGAGQLQVRQTWKGASAEAMRVAIQQISRERLIKSFSDGMEQRYTGVQVVGEPEIEDDPAGNALIITMTYEVPKLTLEQGAYWYVRYTPENLKGAVISSPSSVRTAPLAVPTFPFDGKYSFEVKFPEGVRIVTDPRTQTVRSKYFTYAVTTAYKGNTAKATLTLKTLADRVDVQDLKKFSDDLAKTDDVSPGVILIPKRFIRSKKLAAANKKDIAQTLLNNQKEAIDNTTVAIKSGKLSGNDLAASYCSRAAAYSALGKATEALRDAGEALKHAPNSPDMAACRAGVYFMSGEFERSVADYSKALSLGATDAVIFRQRGISNFYAGKLDGAAEDFSKASADGDDESKVYSDIWLVRTYQRLGKTVPEDVTKRAAAQPRGDWPRPALATLSGALTPEEMLKLLERKRGEERQLASAEGYFYLGQYYLARGDNGKAREFFEKTRQLKVIPYLEHIAAGHELRIMKPADTTTTGTLPAPSAGPAPKVTPPPAVSAVEPAPKAATAPAVPAAGSPPTAVAPPAVSAIEPGPRATTPPTVPGAGSPPKAPPPPAVSAVEPAPTATAPPAGAAAQPAPAAAAPKPPRPKKATRRIDPNWNTKLLQ